MNCKILNGSIEITESNKVEVIKSLYDINVIKSTNTQIDNVQKVVDVMNDVEKTYFFLYVLDSMSSHNNDSEKPGLKYLFKLNKAFIDSKEFSDSTQNIMIEMGADKKEYTENH